MSGVLKSTAADRAAVFGHEWDGNGWRDGHPVDDTDYKAQARWAACDGDYVKATYYATLALVQQQKLIAEQQRIGNLIAYVAHHDWQEADYEEHPAHWSDDFDADELDNRREVAVQQILEGLGL